MPFRNNLPQFLINGYLDSQEYKSQGKIPKPPLPVRTRGEHARRLIDQLTSIVDESPEYVEGISRPDGIYLDIESKEGFKLAFQSLDLPSKGIELLSVKETIINEVVKTTATIFIPTDKVENLFDKLEKYRDENHPTYGKPRNQALVESIESIRKALIKSLWTDNVDQLPLEGQKIWWEIWLRATNDSIIRFQEFSKTRDILTSKRYLKFPDRHVVLAYTNSSKISIAIETLGFIAELRRAKETTADFLDMDNVDQVEWSSVLQGLTNPLNDTSPIVCIFDTGVHRQHNLISNFLHTSKTLSCSPSWGVHDHAGHGTKMAGVILYGDLGEALGSTVRIDVPCSLESVKIIPSDGENRADLYGNIIEEAISRATLTDVNSDRIICMAVTSTDFRDQGKPSSWSASVDKICAGIVIENKNHLFIISAGNIKESDHLNYPAPNLYSGVHDPGQAWNALTVGAYTEKDIIDDTDFADWRPLAPVGDIGPSTTTSLSWESKWPFKPELMFEGGNAAINSSNTEVDYPDSMLLLTTSKNTLANQFAWIADTSAASAHAAHFAAKIKSRYPDYWPETIRALMVHSAEWTAQMKVAYPSANKSQREKLLRTCGYGVPNLDNAISCASNHLTLISQQELQPFKNGKMNELHLHKLPWPVETLRTLGDTQVKMTVTLSYFVEPNPAQRGWLQKFRYQSHGLRFDVKTGTETNDQFIKRINKAGWDLDLPRDQNVTSSGDSDQWYFGKNARSRGSIHKDVWIGTGATLAERATVAVFPVSGWWKDNKDYSNNNSKYTLVVSISTPDTDVDLYTPVETQIINYIETINILS